MNAKYDIIYCLSEIEFSVLQSAYGIDSLLCFKEKLQGETERLQRQYYLGISDLYRRDLLVREGDCFRVSAPVADIFDVLRRCRLVMKLVSINREFAAKLFYFSDDRCFAVLMPGVQGEEYVRMELHSMKRLKEILEECIPENTKLVMDFAPWEMETKIIFLKPENGDERACIGLRQCNVENNSDEMEKEKSKEVPIVKIVMDRIVELTEV